jgi:hypothetical protein
LCWFVPAQEVIRQHTGATDPVTEGFRLALGGGSTVGPVTNDLGFASWKVESAGDPADYLLSLTTQEQALVAGQDVAFSATLRIIKGRNMYMVLWAGSQKFLLGFDQQPDGDPIVRAQSGPPYSLSPVFVFESGGPGYHSYELAYSGASSGAALWVDGVERVSGIPSVSGDWGWGGYWGAVQGASSEANWSSVTFAIVPEPSCLALFGCGGLLLCARCLRAIAARQSSAACGRSGGLAFQPAQSGAEAPACRAVTGTVTELNALPDVDYPWGNNYPESTDECLKTAVEARPESLVSPPDYCTRPVSPLLGPDPTRLQIGDFSPAFSKTRRVVVLITDAPPGGFCDPEDFLADPAYALRALSIASEAYNAGIKVNSIHIPRGEGTQAWPWQWQAESIMQRYGGLTCGWYAMPQVAEDVIKETVLRAVYSAGTCAGP